jgi:hypothetical protein
MNREPLLDKIRALMAKTVANGCTESEALAALDKARAMMDAYEVTEDDLQLTKEEKAVIHRDAEDARDPHKVKWQLVYAISKFVGVEAWRQGGTNGAFAFCGLRSDIDFAQWLLDSLAQFVINESANHLVGNMADKATRRLQIKSFVMGATTRISRRMFALVEQSKPQVTSNGHALVVIKNQAIAEKMEAEGIKLRTTSTRRTSIDCGSYNAGQAAGERASFGRPVNGSGAIPRIAQR